MSSIVIDCPVCGLGLTVATAAARGGTDTARNGAIGGHIHMVISPGLDLACLNGHKWQAKGDFLLERVG